MGPLRGPVGGRVRPPPSLRGVRGPRPCARRLLGGGVQAWSVGHPPAVGSRERDAQRRSGRTPRNAPRLGMGQTSRPVGKRVSVLAPLHRTPRHVAWCLKTTLKVFFGSGHGSANNGPTIGRGSSMLYRSSGSRRSPDGHGSQTRMRGRRDSVTSVDSYSGRVTQWCRVASSRMVSGWTVG